jgi:hypothetical protein
MSHIGCRMSRICYRQHYEQNRLKKE